MLSPGRPSYKVREARSTQNPEESAELVSPEIQGEIEAAVAGDVASRRHHLLPFLWLKDAVITRVEVIDKHEHIDVRFSISGAEQDVDDVTGQPVAGDGDEHTWADSGDSRAASGRTPPTVTSDTK